MLKLAHNVIPGPLNFSNSSSPSLTGSFNGPLPSFFSMVNEIAVFIGEKVCSFGVYVAPALER